MLVVRVLAIVGSPLPWLNDAANYLPVGNNILDALVLHLPQVFGERVGIDAVARVMRNIERGDNARAAILYPRLMVARGVGLMVLTAGNSPVALFRAAGIFLVNLGA